jgi:hypothetical protein
MSREIHTELRTFIDLVIVPALVERLLRDNGPLIEVQPHAPTRRRVADWKRVGRAWIDQLTPGLQ